jgi:putative oxidoreductase
VWDTIDTEQFHHQDERMPRLPAWAPDVGLLTLRAAVAAMMLHGHGLPKLLQFEEKLSRFADPLGIGSPASLSLAVFGEVVCSVLLLLGVATRFAAVPFLVTMLVAAFVVHADDPWARKELALLYAVPALTLVFTGPGRFSIDGLIERRRAGRSRGQPPTP